MELIVRCLDFEAITDEEIEELENKFNEVGYDLKHKDLHFCGTAERLQELLRAISAQGLTTKTIRP